MNATPKLIPVVIATYDKARGDCDVTYNSTPMDIHSHYDNGTLVFFALSQYVDIAVVDYWSKYLNDRTMRIIDHFAAAQPMSYGYVTAPHLLVIQGTELENTTSIVLYRIEF